MFTPLKATKFIIFAVGFLEITEVEVFKGFRTFSLASDTENSKARTLPSIVVSRYTATLSMTSWFETKADYEVEWLSFYRDYFCHIYQQLSELSTEVDSKFMLFWLDTISLPYLLLDYYRRPTSITDGTAVGKLFAIRTPHFLASDDCILN